MSREKKKFKDTAIGKFVTNVAPEILDKVDDFFPPVGILTAALKGKNLSPEQQAEFDKLAVEYESMRVRDMESARNREVLINQSEHASWMAKNTASIIALAFTLFTFVIYFLVLIGHLKASENMSILIVNSITNIVMLIVGYYYGSSDRRGKLKTDQG
jgi:hypothetical protein